MDSILLRKLQENLMNLYIIQTLTGDTILILWLHTTMEKIKAGKLTCVGI